MAREHWHCESNYSPGGSPPAHPGQLCGSYSLHNVDSESVQETWHPIRYDVNSIDGNSALLAMLQL